MVQRYEPSDLEIIGMRRDDDGDYVDYSEYAALEQRVKVVVPNLNDFEGDFNLLSLYGWLLKSPEECCQDAADFIKSRHDLFPWVVEMMEVNV